MRIPHSKTAVFLAAFSGMLLFGISLITLGSLAPSLKTKFMLDGVASGTLFSILPIGILAGSFVFGPVCDHYGFKRILILACMAMTAGFEGIAFARSIPVLKSCVFLFGLGGGIINGSTNALIADISEKNKGANLSLLGVFFGIGALGMPLLLGLLSNQFSPFHVVAAVGLLPLLTAVFYLSVPFPPAKLKKGTPIIKRKSLFQPLLLLVAFFLFFQSSLEAIVNNWSTTYLITRGVLTEREALFALSLHIVGMVAMRLVTGSLFRSVSQQNILAVGLVLLFLGIILMQAGEGRPVIITGLILSGAGLAGGFPVMLGFVGERFALFSGTAFSFVFAVALAGNMLVNYAMGVIVDAYGVKHLPTVSYVEIVLMSLLFFFISKKL